MSANLRTFEIDWGWQLLSNAERAQVRRHEARLRVALVPWTRARLEDALARASRDLPGRQIRARVRDEGGTHVLVATDGSCVAGDPACFDPAGGFPDTLTDEELRAAAGPGPVDETVGPAGGQKLLVPLDWPADMLRAMEEQSRRLGQPLSWVVQKAWLVVRNDGGRTVPQGEDLLPRGGTPRKQSIYLPLDIYAELAGIAAREDRSMSRVMQLALAVAWPVITDLPGADGSD